MTPQNDSLSQLEAIVAATTKAIRAGDLTAMAELAAQTEAAIANLAPQTDVDRISALRDLAARNAKGLEAAAKGVRAARRRLDEVISARSGTQTYDNVGKSQTIGGPNGAIKARL